MEMRWPPWIFGAILLVSIKLPSEQYSYSDLTSPNHCSKATSGRKFPPSLDGCSCGCRQVQQMSQQNSFLPIYQSLMKGGAIWWVSLKLLFHHGETPKTIHLSGTNPGHVGIVLFSSTCFSFCARRGEAMNSGEWKYFQIRASWLPDLLSQSSALNNSGNRKTRGVVNYRDVKTVEHDKQIFSWWGYKQSRKHGCAWPNTVATY